MKPIYLLSVLLIYSTSFAQHMNVEEIGMGYGAYEIKYKPCDFGYIQHLTGQSEGNGYTDFQFIEGEAPIRSFEAYGLFKPIGRHRVRTELYIGAKVAAQFQHRTLMIATKEIELTEQMQVLGNGNVQRTFTYDRVAYTLFNDNILLGPQMLGRYFINDRLSVSGVFTTSVSVPIKNATREAHQSGQIIREFDGDELVDEFWGLRGNLDNTWFKQQYKPMFNVETAARCEYKPFRHLPYYATMGLTWGHHFGFKHRGAYGYKGIQLGISARY